MPGRDHDPDRGKLTLEFKDRAELERQINGALRAAINNHGPITVIGPAMNRLVGQLIVFKKE